MRAGKDNNVGVSHRKTLEQIVSSNQTSNTLKEWAIEQAKKKSAATFRLYALNEETNSKCWYCHATRSYAIDYGNSISTFSSFEFHNMFDTSTKIYLESEE